MRNWKDERKKERKKEKNYLLLCPKRSLSPPLLEKSDHTVRNISLSTLPEKKCGEAFSIEFVYIYLCLI